MQALIPNLEAPGRVQTASVPEPVPDPDEAIVEVAAFSINRGETFLLKQPRPGWRPGKDIAGTVLRAAADGTGPAIGQRVVGHPEQGGWAERAAVPATRLAVLPDEVPFVAAAALPLAGLTGLRLLRVAGPLPSRRVLLTGASGGVGHYFVELAAAHGALITAISASQQRGARLRALGAAAVHADIADAEGPFDVAIESVGGETTVTAWHKLEPRGLLIWLGQAGGAPLTLDYLDWAGAASATFRKFNYLDSTHTEAEDLATLVRLVAGGRLHPELGRVEHWSRTGQTIEALLARELRGNAVLTIGAPELGSANDRGNAVLTIGAPELASANDGAGSPKAVIKRYVAALNAHDGAAVAASFAEDAVWRVDGELPISGTWSGREAIIDGFFAAAGTLLEPESTSVEITRLLAEGEQVTLQWTSRARTRAGAPYENHCLGLFTIRDGRIQEVREYMDTHGAWKQTLAREVVPG